jgi:hypothetical protein
MVAPTSLITVVRAHADDPNLAGVEFCVISVQETDREWFYLRIAPDANERFLARFGNETLAAVKWPDAQPSAPNSVWVGRSV